MTGGATTVTGATLVEHPDAAGRPHPTIEIQVRGPSGDVLGDGEVGEICVRAATVFRGYWEDQDATSAAFFPGRWYRSGDFGRIGDGLLFVESRRTDLIIRGGENVYPAEIEHRLVEHPDITAAAVLGAPDRELGQIPVAHVVVRDGASLSADDVRAWAARGLARFKVPVLVEFRASLPYTETGKVMKHLLEPDAPGDSSVLDNRPDPHARA
jgi:acyl-CoA synthetase (AMP-forming)/AMP-acid ligase II